MMPTRRTVLTGTALARIFHEQEDYQLFLLLAEFWQIGLI